MFFSVLPFFSVNKGLCALYKAKFILTSKNVMCLVAGPNGELTALSQLPNPLVEGQGGKITPH